MKVYARIITITLILVFLVSITLMWKITLESQDYGYLTYVLVTLSLVSFNTVVMMAIGSTAVRAIVFPYSFWMTESIIIGSNSIRYGEDYVQLAEKVYTIMRSRLLEDTGKPTVYSKRPLASLHPLLIEEESMYLQKKSRENYSAVNSPCFELNQKFKSMINLSDLFSFTNRKVI